VRGLFAVVLAALGGTAAAEPPKAPAGDYRAVAEAAFHYSPALKAARQSLKATQELYPQALANYQPQIGLSAGITDENIDNSNFAGADGSTTKDAGVTLDQPLYRGGRSRAQKNEAKARIRAQKAVLSAAEQRIMADAMLAAVNAGAAAETLAVQQATEGLYQRLLKDTGLRRDGGEATDTDMALAESRLGGVTADRLAAQNRLMAENQALIRMTGQPAAAWHADRLAARALSPSLADFTQVEGAVAAARDRNPDRQVLTEITDAENHGIELAAGELLPQLRFIASWTREWDPQPGIIDEATSRRAGLRLTMPLYEGGGTRARVRQARHRFAESRFAVQDYDVMLDEDVHNAWQARETARLRADTLARQAGAARLARDNIETEIAAGEKTMTDLLQADETWLESQVEEITARQAYLAADIELMRLTGALMPAALGIAAEDPDEYLDRVRHRTLSTRID
jgi:TolC family type I secretion outer membrane protein